jgi:hypothetical protein
MHSSKWADEPNCKLASDAPGFTKDCGRSGPPFRWDAERSFLLCCELNATFFHPYLPAEANGRSHRPRPCRNPIDDLRCRMKELLKVIELLERHWHRRLLAWLLPLIGFSALVIFEWAKNQRLPTISEYVVTAVVVVTVESLWFATHWLKKNKRGRVGIAVAITPEDPVLGRQVSADFIDSLKTRLQTDREASRFHLVIVPEWAAVKCQDAYSAVRILRKVRCHFILYGRVDRRQIGGKSQHILRFEGAVVHGQLAPDVQKTLRDDFNTTLPRKIHFPDDNSIFSFEATSEWAEVAARYVVGLAAMYSGDLGYAEQLLLSVRDRLRSTSPRVAPLQEIARRLPARLRTLYEAWQAAVFDIYYLRRERNLVLQLRYVSDNLLSLDPKHYGALLSAAICDFVLDRNVKAAKRRLGKCTHVEDVAWRYSLAFLHAYEGNMKLAREEYQRAFQGPLRDVTLPVQVEEFMQMILDEEPGKAQLHYCSAVVNLRAKQDREGARRDFSAFLNDEGSKEYPEERRRAERFLKELTPASE